MVEDLRPSIDGERHGHAGNVMARHERTDHRIDGGAQGRVAAVRADGRGRQAGQGERASACGRA
jgi:hypothetical protein